MNADHNSRNPDAPSILCIGPSSLRSVIQRLFAPPNSSRHLRNVERRLRSSCSEDGSGYRSVGDVELCASQGRENPSSWSEKSYRLSGCGGALPRRGMPDGCMKPYGRQSDSIRIHHLTSSIRVPPHARTHGRLLVCQRIDSALGLRISMTLGSSTNFPLAFLSRSRLSGTLHSLIFG